LPEGGKVAEVSGGIKKAVSARETAARAWRKLKQGGGKKRKSGSRKRSGSKAEGGAACLKETVNRKLKQNSGVLANLLLDKAREGDLPTIRYVVNLAEQHEAKEEVIDPGPLRSQALEWAAEPQWVEPEKGELQPRVGPEEEELEVEELRYPAPGVSKRNG